MVKLEGGVGKRTVPLLIAETSFDAQVRDWSSKVGHLFYLTSTSKSSYSTYLSEVDNPSQVPVLWHLTLDLGIEFRRNVGPIDGFSFSLV